MYKDHQPLISSYGWSSAEGTRDILVFARLCVRRKITAVPSYMKRWRELGIDGLQMAQERDSVEHIEAVARDIWEKFTYLEDTDQLMRDILSIYGMGMAKAGFSVQLLCGDYGCLDVHNIRRFGLDERSFRVDAPWPTVEGRIQLYKTLCKELGGSRVLWDGWCEYVGELYKLDAETISQLHVDAIIGS